MSNKLMSIQVYSLNLPNIPPRSSLYSLEPIGVGTPLVESFTSYLSRLAQEHCLLPTTLMKKYVNQRLKKEISSESSGKERKGFFDYGYLLNSSGDTATTYVSLFEKLTLIKELKILTLLTFSDVLALRDLVRKERHWCPMCYQEWCLQGEVIYEPLLWAVNVVNICPYHNKKLQNFCPFCKKSMSIFGPSSVVGYCSNCRAWLGNDLEDYIQYEPIETQIEWEAWVSREVGCLIANTPIFTSPPSKEVISQNLSTYVKSIARGSIQAFADRLGMPRQMITNACTGRTAPLLKNLLQICYRINVSPLSFLRSSLDIEVSNETLPLIKIEEDVEDIREALKFILDNNECPPIVTEIASHLGCTITYLYTHASDLCHQLVQKRKNYIFYENEDKVQPKASYKSYKSDTRRKINSDEIRSHLEAILKDDNYSSMSLREVSIKLGFHEGVLRRHARDLCCAISKRYQAHRKMCKNRKIEEVCLEVQRIVNELYSQGIDPTEHYVGDSMSKPGYLREREVLNALYEERRRLGL